MEIGEMPDMLEVKMQMAKKNQKKNQGRNKMTTAKITG